MSTSVLEKPNTTSLASEVAELRARLAVVEGELLLLRQNRGVEADAALRRLRDSWAAMSSEDQAEATRVFKEAERQSRAPRVDD